MKEDEIDNDWAKDKNGKHLHVFDVESGQKGYYCMGCHQEMSAKKSKDEKRYKSHFAHVARDVLIERKCTFSSETYRHKLAKDILQQTKKVKVPSVKVYSEDNNCYMVVREAHFVEAHSVRIELATFEDENGEIKHGKTDCDAGKHLFVRPDVTFLDKNGRVILFIEFVATHKVDNDKLFKLRSLGIDTIEVSLPRVSAQKIEEALVITKHTKWLYNYEQENTSFKGLQPRTYRGVSEIDEFERKILERGQSIECKISEVSNFIRKLESTVGAERFRESAEYFRRELHRVKRNTEDERRGIEQRAEEIDREVFEDFGGRRNRIEEEKAAIEAKAREVEIEEEKAEGRRIRVEERYRYRIGEIESKFNELEARKGEFEPDCQSEIDRIEDYFKGHGNEPETLGELEKRIERNRAEKTRAFDANKKELERRLESGRKSLNRIEQTIRGFAEEEEIIIRRIREEYDRKGGELRERYEKLRRDTIEAIEREDSKGVSRIAERLDKLVQGRKLFDVQQNLSEEYKRLQTAERCFKKKDFKHWLRN